MGKRSRTKGHAWEREVANRYTEATGLKHERVLTETRESSHDVEGPLPLVNQCKVGARPNLWTAIEEAAREAEGTGRHAVAILKRNGAGRRSAVEVAALPLDDWFEIVALLVKMGVWK